MGNVGDAEVWKTKIGYQEGFEAGKKSRVSVENLSRIDDMTIVKNIYVIVFRIITLIFTKLLSDRRFSKHHQTPEVLFHVAFVCGLLACKFAAHGTHGPRCKRCVDQMVHTKIHFRRERN